MERATQERLVGASLLIVAGVIMIPWLLDGKTEPALAERELVLPGSSNTDNETRRISLDLPGQGTRVPGQTVRELDSRTVKGVDEPATAMSLPTPAPKRPDVAEPASRDAAPVANTSTEPSNSTAEVPARFRTTMNQSQPPKPAPTVAEPASKPVAEASPSPAAVRTREAPARVAPQPTAATPTRTVASATSPPTGRQGWAVQVGSFASKDNADRLSELLRGKSYNAFVMPNETNGRVLYRVRVGPVSERSEAELLAGALREDRQPARVLTHP